MPPSMGLTLTFHTMSMVCALAVVAFAAGAAARRASVIAMTLTFGASAALLSPERLPGAEWIALAAMMLAIVSLWAPAWPMATAIGAGALAAVWVQLLRLQGIPTFAGVTAATLVMAVTTGLTRRRACFAPSHLRDEALLVVLGAAGGLAVLPGVLDGWRSATALNAPVDARAFGSMPLWAFGILAIALTGGAAHAAWSRR